jgi:hypothetical protein
MAKYLIHACKEREWYVYDFLIPSMTEQGIKRDDIEVWMDDKGMGCLESCMACFAEYGKRDGGRWHLQDDVVISSDFKKKTEMYDDGVVAGFGRNEWQSFAPISGRVPAAFLWNSFQCIRIPDAVCRACAEWYYTDAKYWDIYAEAVRVNKMDDTLFHDFYTNMYPGEYVVNLNPSIVDHIDFLIGGSVINKWRGHTARGDYWTDTQTYENIKEKLARR